MHFLYFHLSNLYQEVASLELNSFHRDLLIILYDIDPGYPLFSYEQSIRLQFIMNKLPMITQDFQAHSYS